MKLSDLTYQPNVYLAFVLDDASRQQLLAAYPPDFSSVICHHVTIIYNLNEVNLEQVKPDLGTVLVTGHISSDGVECFTATVGGKRTRVDGGWYHVTSSVEPPKKPVDSNTLLASIGGKVSHSIDPPIELGGAFKFLPR